MKTLIALLFALAYFGRCLGVESVPLSVIEAQVTQYCVTNGTDLIAYTKDQDGNRAGRYLKGGLSFKTKLDLDKYCQEKVVESIRGALTNSALNRDGVFTITVSYSKLDPDVGDVINYFYVAKTFRLIKSKGVYSLPSNITSIKMELPALIVYKLAQKPSELQWARYDDGTILADTLAEPNIAVIRRGSVFVPRESALSGSATIWCITGTGSKLQFMKRDGAGNLKTENQPLVQWIPYVKSPSALPATGRLPVPLLGVVGGEPGRTYETLTASSIDGPWSPISGSQSTFWPDRSLVSFQDMSEGTAFFRVRPVENKLPVRED